MPDERLPRAAAEMPLLVLLLALLLLTPTRADAAEQVGRVLVAVGGVTATQDDVSARGLGRGDPVHAGDMIRTTGRGRVQMRFRDGALVDLEPNSRFEVEEYSGGDGGGSVVMRFLRGAMRTITGAIGVGSGESYEMNTTVATIGVRGTAYALRYCDASCIENGGQPGLYGRVDDGVITADGPLGRATFNAGDYFFVPENAAPRRIVVPPDGILDGGEEGGSGGGEEETDDVETRPLGTGEEDEGALERSDDDLLDTEYESAEDQTLLSGYVRPGVSGEAFFAGAFVGGGDGGLFDSTAFVSPDGGEVRFDSADAIVAADFPTSFVDASDATLAEFQTRTVTVDGPSFDVTWGRWEGSLRTVGEEDGDSGVGGFAFAYTDTANITPSTDLVGSVSYVNAFGPKAVGLGGNLWDVSGMAMNADFDSPGIVMTSFNLDRTDGGISLSLLPSSVSGTLDTTSSSLSLTGFSMTGDDSYTGEISGRFVGGQAGAVLLRFELDQDGGENVITGVQLIEESGV